VNEEVRSRLLFVLFRGLPANRVERDRHYCLRLVTLVRRSIPSLAMSAFDVVSLIGLG
jgi:hypothetical protein